MLAAINWDVNPVIFHLGSFGVRWYSLLFALGFLVGYKIVERMFNQEKIDLNLLDSLLVYLIVATVIGARVGHCVFYDWAYFSQNPLEIFLPVKFNPEFRFTGFQGLASHGGALGILVALTIWSKKISKHSLLWILDRVTVPVALVAAMIRTGNLFNSEIYGNETTLPWGFVFLQNGETFAKHPTQLYEAFCYLVTFGIMMYYYRRTNAKDKTGFLTGIFFIGIFLSRFFIEFIKESQEAFEESMALNMGQLLSIPFVLAGIYLLFRGKMKVRKN